MELQTVVTILVFIIVHIFAFLEVFVHSVSSYCLLSSHLICRAPWSISFRGKSSGNKLPQLLFIWECLNLSSLLKDSFTRYRILDNILLAVYSLNILAHCLLASKVSDEKSTDHLIEHPLFVTRCFSLLSKLSSAFISLMMMYLCVGLLEFVLLEDHLV